MNAEPESTIIDTEKLLVNRLSKHALLDIADLAVRVRQGVACIEGCVPNLKQKSLAGEVASQAEGVSQVVNMIKIEPMAIVDDDMLMRHITQALARCPYISDVRVSVMVVNGIIHLKGSVNTGAEKRLAEDEAWATAGVKDTINELEVLSEVPRNSTDILDQILQGFSQCLGLDLSKIQVEISLNVVYLTGTVPNEYIRAAAEELARWTPPIVNVVNELNVGQDEENREAS